MIQISTKSIRLFFYPYLARSPTEVFPTIHLKINNIFGLFSDFFEMFSCWSAKPRKMTLGHFILVAIWPLACLVSANPNKHFLEPNEPTFFHSTDFTLTGPVAFSARVRRQLQSGPGSFYIYDTDTEEESGPWGPWESGKLDLGSNFSCNITYGLGMKKVL